MRIQMQPITNEFKQTVISNKSHENIIKMLKTMSNTEKIMLWHTMYFRLFENAFKEDLKNRGLIDQEVI